MDHIVPNRLDASQGMRRFHAYRTSLRARRLNLHPPG
jgi:hypothetical protein